MLAAAPSAFPRAAALPFPNSREVLRGGGMPRRSLPTSQGVVAASSPGSAEPWRSGTVSGLGKWVRCQQANAYTGGEELLWGALGWEL